MSQKIEESFSRGKKVCGLNFDISKAFDKVWHAGIIYKLILLNIPKYIIRFIKSFLTDRILRVKVNESLNEARKVSCSLPQGSALGLIIRHLYKRYPTPKLYKY